LTTNKVSSLVRFVPKQPILLKTKFLIKFVPKQQTLVWASSKLWTMAKFVIKQKQTSLKTSNFYYYNNCFLLKIKTLTKLK